MPEDNIPNDNLNQFNSQDALNDLSGINPPDGSQPINPAFLSGADDIADVPTSPAIDATTSNYNFDEINGNAINSEVKIDTDIPSNEPVTIRPVEFSQFDSYTPTNTDTNKNLELLMDIKLELTVELGRCHLPVKKVLELTRGSIIELDKVAGESVELYANGKHVANGEVVVIEDNFGLRITRITDPEERIKSL